MPLLWLSLACFLGLLAGSSLPVNWGVWVAVMAAAVAAAVGESRWLKRLAWYITWRKIARLPFALLLAAFSLGALRAGSAQPVWSAADLAWYNGQGTVSVVGVINQPPDKREKTIVLQIEAETLAPLAEGQSAGRGNPVRGQLLARLPTGGDWRYGDRVALVGSLSGVEEEGSASYASYLSRQGINSVINYPRIQLVQREAGNSVLALLFDLRSLALRTINQLWQQPESALMAGILLGYDRSLPPEVTEAFQHTGTAHIIAISGFNISILAGLFVRGFGRLMRRWLAVVLALLAIGFYILLVGAQPSVVRAGIMGAVGLLGPLLGRRQVGANSLAFVAALMCLIKPDLPGDVSFQLSFSGTLGLVLFADPLLNWLTQLLARRVPHPLARRIATPIAEYFLFTLAAQAATLPIIAYHFQRVSLSAVIANPFILPIQPLVMVLGGIALIAGLAWLPLGQLVAGVVWPLPAYTIRVVEGLAQLPNGSLVTGQASLALVVLYYVLLFILAAGLLRPGWFKRWAAPGVLVVAAALLAAGVWRSVLAAPDARLHITLLGLESGPALLVRAPGGQTVLLNGAADARALEDALARRLPPFGAHLDSLLVTTRFSAPLNALASVVERFPVRQVYLAKSTPPGAARDRLLRALRSLSASNGSLQDGDSFDLGGASLRVLLQTRDATTLLLEWGDLQLLVPGGATSKELARLDEVGGFAPDVLLLNAADLESQPPEEWDKLGAGLVIWLQPGATLNHQGWLNLEEVGWLEVTSDGKQMWLQKGR